MTLVVAGIVLGSALPCPAAVYKCSTSGNGVTYQDTPCTPGSELRNLDKDPPPLTIVPGLPSSDRPREPDVPRAARGAVDRSATKARSRVEKAEAQAGERRFIRAGMTEAEVLSRIGRPDVNGHRTDKSASRGNRRAEWSYLPNAGDPQTITTVTLVDGKVTDVRRTLAR